MTKGGFNLIYFLTSFATLAGISWALRSLGFNLVSGIIFFVFLSTVSFFAYRISYSVREYAVIEEEHGFFASISDFLLTPFIRTGQWLAERYSRVNIFTAILDIIIETPFKTLLRIIEQWNAFLRDKRDDVLR
jgi:Na+/phosphate symporter